MSESALLQAYLQTRARSLVACEPLEIEDYGLQAEPFTSPPKWHLAHTSWFFETFILKPFAPGYSSPCRDYELLFNSYYNGIGEQFPRPRRGLLSRPTVRQVMEYRRFVDHAMEELLANEQHPSRDEIARRCTLGIAHEQQHQELLYTDLKYSLAQNPIYPAYLSRDAGAAPQTEVRPVRWLDYAGGLVDIGHEGNGFSFDNEGPRHTAYLSSFSLASHLVTNAQYQDFVDDAGYQRPELWLADGWAMREQCGWLGPQYWLERDGVPSEYTLYGLRPRLGSQPVCHISGYEADAYARWAGARLPTEMEWEIAATRSPGACAVNPMAEDRLHPEAGEAGDGLVQMVGACWQWTASAYLPYPGYRPAAGAIGEYNGKFMCNQWVLRGSSCVSPMGQWRSSYRNFFYLQDRWQFSGLRLARSEY